MGAVLVLPIQGIFGCLYLGGVESEINTLSYDEALPNFFFDYYNLNPLEDLDNQKQNVNNNEPIAMGVKPGGKLIEMLEYHRNKLVSGNIFLKAM